MFAFFANLFKRKPKVPVPPVSYDLGKTTVTYVTFEGEELAGPIYTGYQDCEWFEYGPFYRTRTSIVLANGAIIKARQNKLYPLANGSLMDTSLIKQVNFKTEPFIVYEEQ